MQLSSEDWGELRSVLHRRKWTRKTMRMAVMNADAFSYAHDILTSQGRDAEADALQAAHESGVMPNDIEAALREMNRQAALAVKAMRTAMQEFNRTLRVTSGAFADLERAFRAMRPKQ